MVQYLFHFSIPCRHTHDYLGLSNGWRLHGRYITMVHWVDKVDCLSTRSVKEKMFVVNEAFPSGHFFTRSSMGPGPSQVDQLNASVASALGPCISRLSSHRISTVRQLVAYFQINGLRKARKRKFVFVGHVSCFCQESHVDIERLVVSLLMTKMLGVTVTWHWRMGP